ncbi:MAG TPA: ABC transporter substrate-binding protein [Chloroflexota bacterium]
MPSFRRLPTLALTAVLLAACGGAQPAASGGSASPASKPAGSQWTVALTEEATSLDPGTSDTTNGTNEVQRHIFEALVTYEGQPFKLTPRLAESWTTNGNVWDFKLRSGVKFQNGDDFTSADAEYSLKLDLDAKSAHNIYTQGITNVQAVDPLTLRITTDGPRPGLAANLAQLYILPKSARDKAGLEAFAAKPIGTGPYKLTEFTRGQRIVLDANPTYWRGTVQPQRLTIRQIGDPATRVAELKSGGAQIVEAPPLPQLPELSTGNTEVASLKGARTIIYAFNTTKKPFSDVKVRQAVNYAVNRDAILKDVLEGHGELLHGAFGSTWPGDDPNLKPYAYDPAKAKQLLADAGYSGGFETTWTITSGTFLKDREIAEAVASELNDVGIKVRLQPTERAKLQSDWLAGTFEGMTSVAWGATADPDAMLAWSLYQRKGHAPDGKLNSLIDDSRRTVDPQERVKVLQQLGRYVHDDAYWLFIHAQDEFYAKRRDVPWQPVPEGQSFANVELYVLTPKI